MPGRRPRLGPALLTGALTAALLPPLVMAPSAAAAITYVVDSTLDAPDADTTDGACDDGTGACTLRAAVMQANASPALGPYVIDLAATTYTLTVDGADEDASATGDLDILTDITIVGEGPTVTRINESFTTPDRILHAVETAPDAGGVLTLSQVVVSGGGGVTAGGNVLVDHEANLINVHLLSGGAADGGNLAVSTTGQATVSESVVAAGSAGRGAGIHSDGDLDVVDSQVINNIASFGIGGGIHAGGLFTLERSYVSGNAAVLGRGAGLYLDLPYDPAFPEASAAHITDSSIANNPGSTSTAVERPLEGGGIYVAAGRLYVERTTISGNAVGEEGAGIYATNGELILTDAVVIGNSARVAGGGIRLSEGAGGATATLERTTLRNNSASEGGGAHNGPNTTMSLVDSQVGPSNSATSAGGGIWHDGNQLSLRQTTVVGNDAARGAGIDLQGGQLLTTNLIGDTATRFEGNVASSDGGGIRAAGGSVDLLNVVFDNNQALTGAGGAMVAGGSVKLGQALVVGNSAATGGGVQVGLVGVFEATNATFTGNSASAGQGGAIEAALAGAISLEHVTSYDNSSGGGASEVWSGSGLLTIQASIVTGAQGAAGPDCGGTGMTSLGGNVFVAGEGCATVASDVVVADTDAIGLLGLDDWGGPAETIALSPGSPAIGAFTACSLVGVDARDVSRGGGGPCDAGAFEAPMVDLAVAPALSPVVAGASTVDPSVLPSSSFLPPAPGEKDDGPAAIPLTSVDLSAGVGEIGATPLADIPLTSVPLTSVDLDASPLAAILLSDVPVEGGWARYLRGTALEGLPLQTLTLADALGDETVYDRMANGGEAGGVPYDGLTLAQLGLQDTALRSLPLASIALGATPLTSVPLTSVATTDEEVLAEWCDALADVGHPCADLGIDPSDPSTAPTLLALSLAGVPLTSVPLTSVPLTSVDLSQSPLTSVPLTSVDLFASPLTSVPLTSVDLSSTPLTSVPLTSVPLTSVPLTSVLIAGSPLTSVPLTSVPLTSVPLTSVPLTSVPLTSVPLDAAVLASAPLASVPLTSVDLFSANLAFLPLTSVPLTSVPLTSVPLTSVEIAPLAAVDLDDLDFSTSPDLAAVPLSSLPVGQSAVDCLVIDCGPATELDLLDAQYAGALAGDFWDLVQALAAADPDPGLALSDLVVGLAGTGGAQTTESAVVSGLTVPVALFELLSLDGLVLGDLVGSLGGRRLDDLVGTLSPEELRGYLDGLTADDVVDWESVTFGDLGAALGVLRLSDLWPLLDQGTRDALDEFMEGLSLGDVADWGDLRLNELEFYGDPPMSLWDLIAALDDEALGGLTLGDVLLTLLAPTDRPVQHLDLSTDAEFPIQFLSGFEAGSYSLAFDLSHVGLGNQDLEFEMTVPDGFVVDTRLWQDNACFIVPVGGGLFTCSTLPDPEVDGRTLRLTLPNRPGNGTSTRVTIPFAPTVDLGPFSGRFTVTEPSIGVAAVGSFGGIVEEVFEPNDTTASATGMSPGMVYLSHIGAPGDVDNFRLFGVEQGSRIQVTLGGLPADFDLVVYGPAGPTIAAGDEGEAVPISDDGIDLADPESTTQPMVLQDVPLARDPALTLAAVSADRDTSQEVVNLGPVDVAGDYVLQVSGYNGATSAEPYTLQAQVVAPVAPPACPAHVVPAAATTRSLPADLTGVDTLFLVNESRFRGTHGDAAADEVLAAVDAVAGATELGVMGAIVPVELLPGVADAYATWDAAPCDVDLANAVTSAISAHVHGMRAANPGIRNIVIIGADDQLPMARIPDATTVANERTYAQSFLAFGDDGLPTEHALGAGLRTGHYLTDDVYGDPEPLRSADREVFVTEVALGRLVEAPEDIVLALQNFVTFSGRLDADTESSAFVTGYDFLTDGADAVAEALDPYGLRDVTSLVGETWTADDLADSWLGTLAPDIASLNAHFDHNRALPADQNAAGTESDLFTTADLPGPDGPDLAGSIVFSMGCHAGLSASDVLVGVSDPRAIDWAQELSARGAAFVANTGFGYGDTDVVALSERLMTLFAGNLDGTMTIGDAMAFAKQRYASDLVAYGVYDEKVVQEVVFYGLPMFRVGDPALPPPAPAPLPLAADPITGLQVASIDVDLSDRLGRVDTGRGTYWTVDGETQVTHLRPIQPRTTVDVTQSDGAGGLALEARGALLTALSSFDQPVDAVIARPTVDLAANEPEPEAGTQIFPTALQAVGQYATPGQVRQQVVLVPGQFASSLADPGLGRQRLFWDVQALVHYADPSDPDRTPPAFRQAIANEIGTAVAFTVDVADDVDVARVLVLQTDSESPGTWHATELARQGGTERWTGAGPAPVVGEHVDYFVQAVDRSGNVAVSSNKGQMFQSVVLPPPSGELGIELDREPDVGGWFTGSVTATMVVPTGVVATATIDGGGAVPVADGDTFELVGDGVHVISLAGSSGDQIAVVVPIDASAPTIRVSRPADGDVLLVGESEAPVVSCTDAGSGVATCLAGEVDTSSPAVARTFAASSTDHLGNASEVETIYRVVDVLAPTELHRVGEAWDLVVRGTDEATVDWGDGSPPDILQAEGDEVTGSHVYGHAGLFTVAVTVAGRTILHDWAVIGDGDAKVKAGGQVEVPLGAFVQDPSLQGTLTLGLSTKFKRGGSGPEGQTKLTLHTDGFRLEVDLTDWLVAAGNRAWVSGPATVDSVSGHHAVVVLVDGDPVGDVDRVRVVVRDPTGSVVFDNAPGPMTGTVTGGRLLSGGIRIG